MDILTLPANLPFAIALGLMAFGALMQVLAAGLGEIGDFFGADSTPEIHLGDSDFHSGDIEIHAGEVGGIGGALAGALDWLGVGKIPFFMLISLFFALFGLIGLFLQTQMIGRTGAPLPPILASLLALGISIPALKISGVLLKPILPTDETEAVSPDSFLGKQAVIEIGVARKGKPAQAKLKDEFGQPHYIQVEPQNSADEFGAGALVLIVARRDHIFSIIAGVSEAN